MITFDNYIVSYVLSTKTYHNSQPSTLNSQIASTLNSKLSTCLYLFYLSRRNGRLLRFSHFHVNVSPKRFMNITFM